MKENNSIYIWVGIFIAGIIIIAFIDTIYKIEKRLDTIETILLMKKIYPKELLQTDLKKGK